MTSRSEDLSIQEAREDQKPDMPTTAETQEEGEQRASLLSNGNHVEPEDPETYENGIGSMSAHGPRPRYNTHVDLAKLKRRVSYMDNEQHSVNMRDVGRPETSHNHMRAGILYRSSQIISSTDMKNHGIRTVLDLRVPPAACKASAQNQMQRLNRWLTRMVVLIRRLVLRKKEKLLRRTMTVLVDEDTLEEYPKCIRCTNNSMVKYGVTPVDVYHVDLLPSWVEYWIFYELPMYIKAKVVWMKIKGEEPDNMVAAAVADPEVLGFVRLYKIILKGSNKGIVRALRLFLNKEANRTCFPAIVHCIHGKDRTGLFIMLVYLLCGVPKEDIIKDYALSEVLLKEGRQNHQLQSMPESLTTDAIMASAENVMEATLDFLEREYGEVEGYLMAGGMREDEMLSLKAIFLCPSLVE